jgi:Na+/melibiose symporter-like transporter
LVTGVLTVLFDVAYQSYLPILVDRAQLVDGNAKLEISQSVAQVGGPALAGILYQALKAGAIVVDALSYVWSALCVLLIRSHEPAPEHHLDDAGEQIPLRRQVAEGIRYVLGHRYLRPIALCTATSNLASSMILAVFLTYAVRRLHLSAATIGLIFALASIGGIIGAIAAPAVARRIGVGPTIVWSALLFGPTGLLVPLAPPRAPVPWLVVGFFVAAVAVPLYNITQVSLRQAICPPRLQGRMNATMRFLVWGTMPVGSLLGGVLGTAVGLRATLLAGSIGQLFVFLPVALSPVRRLVTVPSQEGAEEGTEASGNT